jgi:esterase/lipase/1-acyl-sn-glycerol-3-phosphate acyltransferase
MKISTKAFRYTALALEILERVLGSKFSVQGLDKLPQHPVMFVANHFTRSETFFIPYLIYKHTGRQVRCLADASLYSGTLGKFLRSVGTVSTKNPKRDHIILRDLISGEYDWMIYPEGSMVKSKEIKNEGMFMSYTPYRIGPVHTGSAVLALKSQLYRNNLIEAFEANKPEFLHELERDLGISYQEYLKRINTYVVPLNITYYPIRPGENKIKKLISRLVKKIPSQVAEELEIEGNLLLGADINVSFGNPINLAEYANISRNTIQQLPIIKNETKNNFILRYLRLRLTSDFMEQIYSNIQINLDHVFSAALRYFEEQEIEIGRLKRVIYLSAVTMQKSKKYRLNHSLFEENLVKVFSDEPHHDFDSVFALAHKQGIIAETSDGKIRIKKSVFEKKCDFHEIRLENTLQVIANEFALLEGPNALIKRNTKIPDDELRRKVFAEIYKFDLDIFNTDYQINFDKNLSKNKSIGAPFFMESRAKAAARVRSSAILLVHGYKSAPKEVEALAQFLNGFGLKVYAVRLRGHGTAPADLKNISWQDWYDSVQRGYAALKNIASRVAIIGFSTGGLLGLLSCANKKDHARKLCGVVSVNAAMKLVDIKARMVPGINLWNEILDKFHFEKGKFEFIDDQPENPHINYSRNYIHGVNELEKLMAICEENLQNIVVPSLIIQGDNDPVVDPQSGKIIYKKINSAQKLLAEPNFSNHVIINSLGKEEVFELIREFLVKIKII